MALDKQVYLYSVDTSALYDDREIEIHKKMLNLYGIRKCLKDTKKQSRISALGVDNNVEWWSKEINHMLDEYKKELTSVLEERLKDRTPRTLREDAIRDNNVITQFDSSLTRMLQLQPSELTTDLISLSVYFFQVFHSVMLDGFMFNGERYIFLTASAGQIRKKMAVFIKESSYKEIEMTLMCGLTVDEINRRGGINPNKFCAYKALSNSATDVWEDFDIDKSIVVEDFETDVPGEVDYIDETDYSITRKMTNTSIPHTDGCGMMLDSETRMVRMPWVKGLLVTFPFDEFIKEHCGGECIVSDIYGAEHKIIAEGIRYIFTKSQFKLYKYYDSWEQYKAAFKKYSCEACYCNIEEPYIPKAKINYQMLQTLSDMSDDEIEKITRKTREEISKVGADYRTNMRLLGATEYNQTPNSFQKALMIYPELFVDTYSREVLKQTKKSLVKQAKGGRLEVNGRYQFIAPDLYAFSQWLFLGDMNPCGLLADGEVFSQLNTDGVELACLRSPHLYREWAIRRNKKSEEAKRWFGVTKCLYTSCHDLISRYLMFDKQSMSNPMETLGYKTV